MCCIDYNCDILKLDACGRRLPRSMLRLRIVLPCLLFCPSALGLRPVKMLLSRRSCFSCASMIIPALHNTMRGVVKYIL